MRTTSLYERSKTAFLTVMNMFWATLAAGLGSGWGATMAGKDWTEAVGVAFTVSTTVGTLMTAVVAVVYAIRTFRP